MSGFLPERILAGVDLGPTSEKALALAAKLAQAYRAQLEVLLVDQEQPPLEFTSAQIEALDRQQQRNRQALERELDQWVHARYIGDAKLRVEAGEPTAWILRAAADADLLVLGSHRWRGLARLRLGSASESVIRRARVPVLVAWQSGLDRLLCPVNFGPAAQRPLDIAFSLAARLGSRLTVMTAEENGGALSERLEALCSAKRAESETHCDLRVLTRQGNAAQEILKLAQEESSDLIVLGARRRPSPAEAIFGTTTEHLLRKASSNILVVPDLS